jgi:ABC-2 type transport system ATP-binding protein
MSELLKVEGLHKGFGRKKVLRGLSLSLEKGKVCGLLGKNGEGKTTLIRILLGVIPADSGRVIYAGKPVTFADSGYKRTIGYIAEDSIFYRRMRVAELLRFNAAFYPTWSSDRAEAYLGRLSLNRRDKVGSLSRGMALKLGLVVALSSSPELLILDDPTSGLDVPLVMTFSGTSSAKSTRPGRPSSSPLISSTRRRRSSTKSQSCTTAVSSWTRTTRP